MSDANPLISVLMPVYNARHFVGEAVASILNQTLADFEFIIIDDGSTDGSIKILRELAGRDVRIRLVSRPNTGLSAALNEALALSRGELIARMDADDVSLPQRFIRQAEFLAKNPQYVAVGSRVLLIDPDGAPIREMGTELTHEQIDQAHLRRRDGSAIVHPSAMMRRWALLLAGGYRADMEPAEDMDLFLRLAEVGMLANLPEVLLKYRQHPGSVGYRRRRQQLAKAEQAAAEACKRRGLSPTPSSQDGNEHLPSPHRTWAWWALGAGNVTTARKHALAAVRDAPFAPESWRVMICALRGH